MTFQEFSKNYLNIFMAFIFQHFFVLPLSEVFPVILVLDLNDLLFDQMVYIYNIAIKFRIFLNNYHCILVNYTLASQSKYLLHYLFQYYLYDLCSQ